MIELLVVVLLIGIVSAILVTTIDPDRQVEMGEEASKKANVLKACSAIKTYGAEHGQFPEEGTNNNPLDFTDPLATDADKLAEYLDIWPEGLIYNVAAFGGANTHFSVHIKQDVGDYYWKCSHYYNDVYECTSQYIDVPIQCVNMRR